MAFAAGMPSGATAQEFLIDESIRADRAIVTVVQQELADLNFAPGGADGAFGRRTQTSLEQFVQIYAPTLSPGLTANVVALVHDVHDSWYRPPTSFSSTRLVRPALNAGAFDITAVLPECVAPACTVGMFFLAAGDLTRDGLPDVVFSTIIYEASGRDSATPGPLAIMINRGDYRFSAATRFEVEGSPAAVHGREAVIEDFNGDGQNDLFVAAAGLDRSPFPGERNILLLSEGGHLADRSEGNLPNVVAIHHGVTSADFDGDGDKDLFVVAHYSQITVDSYFLVNDGAGRFSRSSGSDWFPSTLRTLSGSINWNLYTTVRSMDVDGDGHLDILLPTSYERGADRATGLTRSRIVFGTADFGWPAENVVELPPTRWGVVTHTTDIDAADLDGDGDLDLLLTETTENDNGLWRCVFHQVLRNDGGRRFVDITHLALWNQGYADCETMHFLINSFLVDLNGDGFPDLVSQSADPVLKETEETPILVAINDGHGVLTPANKRQLVSDPWTGRELRPADIDANGTVDLIGYNLRGVNRGHEFFAAGFEIVVYRNNRQP